MIYINKSLADAMHNKGKATVNDYQYLNPSTDAFYMWKAGDDFYIETILSSSEDIYTLAKGVREFDLKRCQAWRCSKLNLSGVLKQLKAFYKWDEELNSTYKN